jgi:hypothetical protein
MSVVDNSSNNPAYIAAINASEMQRQATEAALRGAFAVPGGRFGESTTGSETAALAAAIKAAAVTDMRQRVSIASQYGQNDAPWRSALRVLLGTDYS